MKAYFFTFCFMAGLIVSSAYADEFTGWQTDWGGMDIHLGEQCSSDGKVFIKCECASPRLGVSATCEFGPIPFEGCRLEGGEDSNNNFYCLDASGENACHICNCNNNQTETSWVGIGGNRVSRTKFTTTGSGYLCQSVSSTEYGCAAVYYKSGGGGATMTCSPCPSSGGAAGTNAVGATEITSCHIPANTQMTDSAGTYVFTSDCYYSK